MDTRATCPPSAETRVPAGLTSIRTAHGCGWLALALALAPLGCTSPDAHRVPEVTLPADTAGQRLSELAATNAVPSHPFTLEQATQKAIESSGTLATLRAALDVAAQRRRSATDMDDPELSLGWGWADTDSASEDWGTQESTSEGSSSSRSSTSQSSTSQQANKRSSQTTSSERQDSTSSSRQRGTSHSIAQTSDEQDSWSAGVRFYVPNPWLMEPKVSARKAEIQAAQADLRQAEWELTTEVKQRFIEIRQGTNDLALATTALSLHDVILASVRSRAESGMAKESDVLDATYARIRAATERDRARRDCSTAWRGLAELLHVPAQGLRIDTTQMRDVELPLTPERREQLESAALRFREDLTALYWRMLAARHAYREVRNGGIPWISQVDASYSEQHETGFGQGSETGSATTTSTSDSSSVGGSQKDDIQPDGSLLPSESTETRQSSSGSGRSVRDEFNTSSRIESQDGSEWQVGFMVNLPIFSWTFNHANDVALAEYKLAATQYAVAMDRITREVRSAMDEVESVRAEWEQYRDQDGPFVDQIRKQLAGLKSTPDLTPDQVAGTKIRIISALRLWREAHLRYRLALVDLERLLGAPLSDLLQAGQALNPDVE